MKVVMVSCVWMIMICWCSSIMCGWMKLLVLIVCYLRCFDWMQSCVYVWLCCCLSVGLGVIGVLMFEQGWCCFELVCVCLFFCNFCYFVIGQVWCFIDGVGNVVVGVMIDLVQLVV